MDKWEYKVIRISQITQGFLLEPDKLPKLDELKKLGEEGWEAVSITAPFGGAMFALLKRRMER